MELNKVLLIGNLTRDPESRFTNNGAQVVKMGLASNRRTGSGDNRREEVLYIDVEAWNRTAELCAQYLKKGSQILVEGRLKFDQYQTQAGENRQKISIVADRVQFGARADGSGGGGGGQSYNQGGNQGGGGSYQSRNVQESSSSYSSNDGGSNAGGMDETEDDLPF